jgi:hypothetical protein
MIMQTQARHADDHELDDPAEAIKLLLTKQALMHSDGAVRMAGIPLVYMDVHSSLHVQAGMIGFIALQQSAPSQMTYMCICIYTNAYHYIYTYIYIYMYTYRSFILES